MLLQKLRDIRFRYPSHGTVSWASSTKNRGIHLPYGAISFDCGRGRELAPNVVDWINQAAFLSAPSSGPTTENLRQ